MNKIITLTSDLNHKDGCLASLKGYLYSNLENIKIIDISHLITPFDIKEAAHIISLNFENFPKGTIHIIAVEAHTNSKRWILAKINHHYFICADNGIISLLTQKQPQEIVDINYDKLNDIFFPEKDILCRTACLVIKENYSMEKIGAKTNNYKKFRHTYPNIDDDELNGTIIYIDHYGNAVSNIKRNVFYDFVKDKPFQIMTSEEIFEKVYDGYGDIEKPGKKIAIFNSTKNLEFAISKSCTNTSGGASSLLGIRKNNPIKVKIL